MLRKLLIRAAVALLRPRRLPRVNAGAVVDSCLAAMSLGNLGNGPMIGLPGSIIAAQAPRRRRPQKGGGRRA